MLCSVVANVPQEETCCDWCAVPWFKRCVVLCRRGGFHFHGMDEDVHGVDCGLVGRVLKRFGACLGVLWCRERAGSGKAVRATNWEREGDLVLPLQRVPPVVGRSALIERRMLFLIPTKHAD